MIHSKEGLQGSIFKMVEIQRACLPAIGEYSGWWPNFNKNMVFALHPYSTGTFISKAKQSELQIGKQPLLIGGAVWQGCLLFIFLFYYIY